MNTLTHTSSINVLLISCVLSAGVSLTSQAGDGVIVTGRTVQGHMYGRTSLPDPYPNTANANPSKEINSALTGELTRDQADEARLLQLALPRSRA